MRIIFDLIVGLLKIFSLPFQITKSLFTKEEQEQQDAKKLLDMLRGDDDND